MAVLLDCVARFVFPSIAVGLMRFLDSIFAIIDTFHHDLKELAQSIWNHAEATQNSANASKAQGVPQSVTISIPDGVESRKSTADKKNDTEYQDKTIFWQRLTFIALIIYAAFTILIYCANKKSADAAQKAANTADSTLKWTKEQFRTEQRPYLSAEGRGGTSQPGGKTAIIVVDPKTGIAGLAVAVDLRNVGKSPAVDTHAAPTEYKIGPRDTVRREVQQYKPQYSTEAAGSIVTMGNGVTAPSEVRILKPDELRHIEDGTWELYIVGGVVYRDIFPPRIDPYETTYCYLFAAKGIPLHNCNFPPSSFGNSIK